MLRLGRPVAEKNAGEFEIDPAFSPRSFHASGQCHRGLMPALLRKHGRVGRSARATAGSAVHLPFFDNVRLEAWAPAARRPRSSATYGLARWRNGVVGHTHLSAGRPPGPSDGTADATARP